MTTLRGHRGEVKSVSFGTNTIASGSTDGTIKLWSRYKPPITKALGSPVFEQNVMDHDGQTVALAGPDNTIQLRTQDGRLIGHLKGHTDEIYSISLSPNGQLIASGSRDQTVRLWNRQGQLLKTFTGHQGDVNSVGFSPDGHTLVSGSDDTTVKLWPIRGEDAPITLRGHQGRVFSVSFAPDGQTIASGSFDKTVKLWSRQTGTEIATLIDPTNPRPVIQVSFIDGGRVLQSSDERGTITQWDRDLESLLKRTCGWLQPYLENNVEGQLEAEKGLCQL